jgi:hypothetical protein
MRDHLDVVPGRELEPLTAAPLLATREGMSVAGGLGHLVGAVLSWLLGEHTVQSGFDTYSVARGLLLYAQVSGRDLGVRPHARTPTILRELGLSRSDVRVLWESQRARDGYQAMLGLDLLLAVFQPPVWQALAMLITDGPERAADITDRLLYQQASRRVAPTASRPEGGACRERR